MALEKLQAAFVQALGIPADTNFDELEYRGIPQWDSVAHMQLVAEIEDAYDIMIETDDVIDMSSFTKIKSILEKYDVNFGS